MIATRRGSGVVFQKEMRDEKWQRGEGKTPPPLPGSGIQVYGRQEDCKF